MAQAARIRWFGPRVQKNIRKEAVRRIKKVAEMVRSQVVRNISTPTRAAGPSLPGQFPHADTGRLRQSIFWAMGSNGLSAIVGTNLWYGLFLEVGTSRTAPRPYLRRTLDEMLPTIRRIMAAPIPRV